MIHVVLDISKYADANWRMSVHQYMVVELLQYTIVGVEVSVYWNTEFMNMNHFANKVAQLAWRSLSVVAKLHCIAKVHTAGGIAITSCGNPVVGMEVSPITT